MPMVLDVSGIVTTSPELRNRHYFNLVPRRVHSSPILHLIGQNIFKQCLISLQTCHQTLVTRL